jgi:hypothetical protein
MFFILMEGSQTCVIPCCVCARLPLWLIFQNLCRLMDFQDTLYVYYTIIGDYSNIIIFNLLTLVIIIWGRS